VLDIGMEEGIGKAMITQARVRLTVERVFEGRHPSAFQAVAFATAFVLVVCLATFIFVDVYFVSYFDSRSEVADRVALQNFARFYVVSSIYSWIYFWGTAGTTSVIDTTKLDQL
jgi:hypothetical protein